MDNDIYIERAMIQHELDREWEKTDNIETYDE